MATYQHSRSSGSSQSSNGSSASYQLILDHILTYPGSYEIPLRTMYSLNCQPRGQTRSGSPTSSNASSPGIQQGSFPGNQTTESFTQNLMTQLSNLPNQASTLPASFITSFVQRCFPLQLPSVDFPQALTGLDYLKDLETRRRREVAAAMDRMDIDRDTLVQEGADFSAKHPAAAQWLKSIEEKERKVDSLYTQIYIGIRRWILINELSLLPFNKANCMAMLNTLYPPMGMPTQPTSKLTADVLKSQREGYFKYILSVEKSGARILNNLMNQGKGATDTNGWASVTRTLSMYLQIANSMINECTSIANIDHFSPQKKRDSNQSRHTRKADSGISFTGSERRPSTRGSTGEPASPMDSTRPKTPSSAQSRTALEKLARGLKGIGRSRTDVTEMISYEHTPPLPSAEKPKMLRKMRSLGSLSDRKASISSTPASRHGSDAPTFNVDEMRQHRARYEASVGVSRHQTKRASNEV